MTSKELVIKTIEQGFLGKLVLDFNPPNKGDLIHIPAAKLFSESRDIFKEWGYHKELLAQVPDFHGEVRMSSYGNIYGRLEGKTKGECVKGALQDSWELLDDYKMPSLDPEYQKKMMAMKLKKNDKFIIGYMCVAIFSTFRDIRLMENALIDTIVEKQKVCELLEKIEKLGFEIIDNAAIAGLDGLMFFDDWGTQTATLISPKTFREIFKPLYASFAKRCHEHGVKIFVHSCGMIYELFDDFIDAKIDVMQLDQPELFGSEKLASEFGDRIAFYCPVDIQKVMATGDRDYIESTCRSMIEAFKKTKRGFIIKDYPTWEDIDIKDEWANWARNIAYEYR